MAGKGSDIKLKDLEPKRKNPITLGNDSNLATDLKPVKIGGKNSILELSDGELKVRGTIDASSMKVDGVSVITESTDVDSLDDLSDVTYSSGDLTITSLDKIIVGNFHIDSSGNIEIDAHSGRNIFKAAGTSFAEIQVDSTSNFILYEQGGASSDDYFKIVTATHGATTISTVDAAGGNLAHLKFDTNGSFLVKEKSAATANVADYGQLWVKSDAPNNLYFTDDTGQDVALTNNGAAIGGDVVVATVTISEAEMNALHTTQKDLVAAQGSGKVIIPISVTFFVDRDASTAQSASTQMHIGINGSTTAADGSWGFIKRWMYNESGDRIFQLHQGKSDEVCQSLTDGDDRPLTAKLSVAITSGSIDSCKVVVSYYVYDNS